MDLSVSAAERLVGLLNNSKVSPHLQRHTLGERVRVVECQFRPVLCLFNFIENGEDGGPNKEWVSDVG